MFVRLRLPQRADRKLHEAGDQFPAAMVGTWFFDNPAGDDEQMAIFPDGRVIVLYSNGHIDETKLTDGMIELAEYGNLKVRTSAAENDVVLQHFVNPETGGGYIKPWKRTDGKPRTKLLRPLSGKREEEDERLQRQAWFKLHHHVSEGWQLYMDDNDGVTAGALSDLKPHIDKEIWPWTESNVVLVSKKQKFSEIEIPSEYPIAYDKSLLQKGHGTNVAFADGHVEYVAIADIEKVIPERIIKAIDRARKAKKAVKIAARFLTADKNWLEDIGLDRESVIYNALFLWKKESELKTEAIASSGPVDKPTSVKVPVEVAFVDDLQVKFFIKATQMHRNSSTLTLPGVTVLDAEEATMTMGKEIPFIAGYKIDHSLTTAAEPVPIHDEIEEGLTLLITPRVTEDGKHCVLELKTKLSRLSGFDRRRYLGKFSYDIPRMDVLELKCRGLYVPAGKSLLLFAPWRDKELLILIKPEIPEAKENAPAALPSIGGPGSGGFGGGFIPATRGD